MGSNPIPIIRFSRLCGEMVDTLDLESNPVMDKGSSPFKVMYLWPSEKALQRERRIRRGFDSRQDVVKSILLNKI